MPTAESPPAPVSPFARMLPPVALALLSGLLLAQGLPPHNAPLWGWFALTPLLTAVSHPRFAPPRTLYRFGLGLLTGIVAGIAQIGLGGKAHGLPFAYLPYLWIAFVFGVVAALAGSAARRHLPSGGIRWAMQVAAIGVSVEWLTQWTPLPVSAALSQWRATPVLQIASVTGIWGVSFLLWLVNAALADAALRRRAALPTVSFAVLLSFLSWGFGAARLALAPRNAPTVTVAAIQDYSAVDAPGADVPVSNQTLPEREELMREAARRGARLMVGSEEAWGSAFAPHVADDPTAALARETNAALVVGFEERIPDRTDKVFNSAALVGPDGATHGIHHKLYPFLGERQVVQAGDFASAWSTPAAKVGLLICFDNCYTGPARQAAQAGAQLIAQPNYDPPTPAAVLHHLHAALTPFRAVENGVAFVRADPNGLSQIIDPYGRIVAETGMYEAVALVAPVPLGDGHGTFFTRWGDWLAYLCLAGAVLGFGITLPRSRYKRTTGVPAS